MRSYAVAVALLAIAAGCNSAPQEIKGRVTLDGTPLEGASVQLMPKDSNVALLSGQSDADGNFVITLMPGASLQPGAYKVTAAKYVPKASAAGMTSQVGIDVTQLKAMGMAENSLPATYESPQQTPLTVELPPPSGIVEVPLLSK